MPSTGVSPLLIGESWFAVETTARPVPSWISQVQPEPKRLTPASFTAALSSSRPPKVDSIAEPSDPLGSPPPLGLMISQKKLWFAWPPALLRTTVRLSSGSRSKVVSTSSTGRSAHSVASSALLAYGSAGTSKGIGRSFLALRARICSRRPPTSREGSHGDARVQIRGDHAAGAKARAVRARRHLARDDQNPLQA